MKTDMKNLQKEFEKLNCGLQSDLLKMVDEDSDDFEETEATNNFNHSEGKESNSPGEKSNLNFPSKEFNFENLGKEFEIKKNVKKLLTFL